MTIGEKIKTRRKQLHMTQEDLSRLTGLSRRSIILYERDECEPRGRLPYEKLANALEVDVKYLFSDEECDVEIKSMVIDINDPKSVGKLEKRLEVLKKEVSKIEKLLEILKEGS